MLRYRCWPCLGLLLLAAGCATPSARDNAGAAAKLVEGGRKAYEAQFTRAAFVRDSLAFYQRVVAGS